MKFPCEIIVWEVLPCIRAALAQELIKRGWSQSEIGRTLGITQAAVSQYTSRKRGSGLKFPPEAKEEIRHLADDLVQGTVDDLVLRICTICLKVRKDEAVCNLELYNLRE